MYHLPSEKCIMRELQNCLERLVMIEVFNRGDSLILCDISNSGYQGTAFGESFNDGLSNDPLDVTKVLSSERPISWDVHHMPMRTSLRLPLTHASKALASSEGPVQARDQRDYSIYHTYIYARELAKSCKLDGVQ